MLKFFLCSISFSVVIFSSSAVSALAAEADSSQPERLKITFKEQSRKLGLKLSNSPAAWADFNNDGWVDLYANGVIWQNNYGKNFKAVKVKTPGSAAAADFNNDGLIDYFSLSKKKLFLNVNGQSFKELEKAPELAEKITKGACWADLDNNGYVDLYVGGYENWKKAITYSDVILLNKNGKMFSLAAEKKGFRARGVTACDFDKDADMDIYVSNYRLQPNILWLNNGKAEFKNVATSRNALATSKGFRGAHSISALWADFNNDGNMDLFISNFAHRDSRGNQPLSRFLRNKGPKEGYTFEDIGPRGLYYQESYASCAAGDYDNDGDLDLFVTTAYATASFGKKNYPVLLRNEGKWKFKDASKLHGLAKLNATYQGAWADFDNDGDLDLAAAGKLFVNQGNENQWLKVKLQGDGNEVNYCAIGAQAKIKLKDRILTRQVEAGTGQGNQNDMTLHYGLGGQKGPVEMQIYWPNGTEQKCTIEKVNKLVQISYKTKQ
jgi:hypothetical protein